MPMEPSRRVRGLRAIGSGEIAAGAAASRPRAPAGHGRGLRRENTALYSGLPSPAGMNAAQ